MTNEEAIEVLNNWDMACPICEKRKSEEKGVCADCRFNKALDLAIKALEERPQGEWIDVPCERDLLFNTGIRYTCSVCGKFNSNGHSSFCPNCGADMRKGDTE